MHEIGAVTDFTCHISGHCVTVYDDTTNIGLQRSTQNESDGLYMYHYLFERFEQTKKNVKKIAHSYHEAVLSLLETQIKIREQELRELRAQKKLHLTYDYVKEAIKTSPFVRSRPSTYHKKVLKSETQQKNKKQKK